MWKWAGKAARWSKSFLILGPGNDAISRCCLTFRLTFPQFCATTTKAKFLIWQPSSCGKLFWAETFAFWGNCLHIPKSCFESIEFSTSAFSLPVFLGEKFGRRKWSSFWPIAAASQVTFIAIPRGKRAMGLDLVKRLISRMQMSQTDKCECGLCACALWLTIQTKKRTGERKSSERRVWNTNLAIFKGKSAEFPKKTDFFIYLRW